MTEDERDGAAGAVRRQYEALPYPERDPGDEAGRLITGSPSHLLEIEHYVYAGRRAGPIRALVAGGGTGDGAIMLAQHLSDRGEGEVVYLDISRPALEIARARAEARGLDNIGFHLGSLLAIDMLELGRFDYIDCCGVLHHLADPAEGLLALTQSLADDGGMGLMLYGAFGRTGVYPLQRALRRLAGTADLSRRLDLARAVLNALPETNWFRRNVGLADHLAGGDAGLADLLLHAQDRAYTVPEIAALSARADLRITGFVPAAGYDPGLYLRDAALRARLDTLDPIERAALGEELAGNLKTHVFYVVKAANRAGGHADPRDRSLTPIAREHDLQAVARSLAKSPRLKVDLDGIEARFELPGGADRIIALMDGRRNGGEILERLRATNSRLSERAADALFQGVYDILHPLNMLLLAGPHAPPR